MKIQIEELFGWLSWVRGRGGSRVVFSLSKSEHFSRGSAIVRRTAAEASSQHILS